MTALFNPQPSRLAFEVLGVPIPKGSTRAFMRPGMRFPIVTADNPKTKPWQEAVVHAAVDAYPRQTEPLQGPVALTLRFYLPKPKSAPQRLVDHLKKPDLDKLTRCVKDGLTRAGVYRDDSQVVAMVVSKHFAAGIFDPCGLAGVPRVHVIVGACELPEIRGGGLIDGRGLAAGMSAAGGVKA